MIFAAHHYGVQAVGVTLSEAQAEMARERIREAGVADYEVASWNALAAPAKTPPAVIDELNAAANVALKTPAVADRLLDLLSERSSALVELSPSLRVDHSSCFCMCWRQSGQTTPVW